MVMEGYDAPDFRRDVNSAMLVVPDGVPLVWAMRLLGFPAQERVYGPELMLRVTAAAGEAGIGVGLLGATDETLDELAAKLPRDYPGVEVVYRYAPPFGKLDHDENEAILASISASGAGIVFVALGCPKQEQWMASCAARTRAVFIGVGAAFDFHAGNLPMAPPIIQRVGMEWAYRWATEPRRLSGRYLKHNPRFLVRFLRQLLCEIFPGNGE
jgi:N-acetylglucosaminyldiphosphoundecaprenol N-acetyl-beta-D-mannosaminyltransferase